MSRILGFIISAVVFLSGPGTASHAPGKTSHWPLIKPFSWSGEMDLLGPPTLIAIHSINGAIAYRLYCSSRLARPEPHWLT